MEGLLSMEPTPSSYQYGIPPTMCHMSCFTCHVSCVKCHFVIKNTYKVVELVVGGFIINGAYPV